MTKPTETPFPPISEELIKDLNNRFPEMSADLGWEMKEVWYLSLIHI